jgi:hypothetical protein
MLAEEIQRQPGLAGSTLMMLSSADRRDNAARCRDLGGSGNPAGGRTQSVLLPPVIPWDRKRTASRTSNQDCTEC